MRICYYSREDEGHLVEAFSKRHDDRLRDLGTASSPGEIVEVAEEGDPH